MTAITSHHQPSHIRRQCPQPVHGRRIELRSIEWGFLIHSFVYSSIRSFVRSFVSAAVYLNIYAFSRPSVHSLNRLFIHLFIAFPSIGSVTRSFIRSFVYFIRCTPVQLIRSSARSLTRSLVSFIHAFFINAAFTPPRTQREGDATIKPNQVNLGRARPPQIKP